MADKDLLGDGALQRDQTGRVSTGSRDVRFSVSNDDDDDTDKTSHSLFCQMNVLNEEGTTWKETSRYNRSSYEFWLKAF